MHYRRLACFLLGAWMAGSLFMMMVATQNFRSVDRLLEAPSESAARQIEALGRQPARIFLRHHVGEQNRWYFVTWERIQLGLGAVLLLVLFFGAHARPSMMVLTLLMLIVVAALHWFFTPEIVRLGRAIDFLADQQPSVERDRFWAFHHAYSTVELIKLGLGGVLSIQLLWRRRRTQFGSEFDVVDDADNSHVDR